MTGTTLGGTPCPHLPRPLPRSNAPHPEESLCGYLLNLAYRLDLKPNQLIKRTGLKTNDRIVLLDAQYATELPDAAAAAFTHSTGLTPTETYALTLTRYAALDPAPHATIRAARSNYGQRWINIAQTRYCPHCLTDPNDPNRAIWRTQWLTPWAIACTRHDVTLLDTCPSCGHRTGGSGHRLHSTLPNPDGPILHPAACRAALTSKADPLCGYRLDHAPTTPATPDALALQRRLDHILDTTTPEDPPITSLGLPVDGPEYLRDLRLLVVLLQLTNAHHHLRGDTRTRETARAYLQAENEAHTSNDRDNRTLTQPPAPISPATGLLLAAAHLLGDATHTDTIEDLHAQATRTRPTAWEKAYRAVPPSEALYSVVTNSKIGFADPRRLAPHVRPQDRTHPATHVPAYLSLDQYRRHFADTDPKYERPVRRAVPLLIVRLLANCDTPTAGQHLGYDPAPSHAAIARASDAFDDHGLTELRRRTARILTEIASGEHINYAHRRHHFHADYQLPTDLWEQFNHEIRTQRRVRTNTNLEARRAAYTAWIWANVTHGDHIAAPMINTYQTQRRHTGGRGSEVIALQLRSHPDTHQIIRNISDQLATRIDASR